MRNSLGASAGPAYRAGAARGGECSGMKTITSTMAGTVLRLTAKSGDVFQGGQEVVVLESMKMEIPVEAAERGTVVEVKVNPGDFVNEGDVLLTYE